MKPDADHCAECGKLLNALSIKHGWVPEYVGRWQARVHTVCRPKFIKRTFDDQKARCWYQP